MRILNGYAKYYPEEPIDCSGRKKSIGTFKKIPAIIEMPGG